MLITNFTTQSRYTGDSSSNVSNHGPTGGGDVHNSSYSSIQGGWRVTQRQKYATVQDTTDITVARLGNAENKTPSLSLVIINTLNTETPLNII
jgi:hypothetical protein